MKKFKSLLIIFVLVFIFPLFCFACDEATLESIAYVNSARTAQSVVEDIDYAKSQTIQNDIKMSLQTEEKYTFYKTSHESFLNRTILKRKNNFLGKDRDEYIFSEEEDLLVDNVLISNTKKVFEKGQSNFNSNGFCYITYSTFDNENVNEPLTNYTRENFNYSSITTISNLYSSIIKKVNYLEFDSVYQKSFQGVTYYKLVANVDGIGFVNDEFNVNNDLFESPGMFLKASNNDYIFAYSCEFGVKEASGTVYITYFKMDYSVYNANREKYLDVSTKTTLNAYGDVVADIEGPEDKGDFVAGAFVSEMNENNFYCSFKNVSENSTNKETTYTVLKIKKQHEIDKENKIEYFDYAIKIKSINSDYFYAKGDVDAENNNAINYIIYRLDVNNKQKSIEDVEFYLDLFDFKTKYNEEKELSTEENKDNLYFFDLLEEGRSKLKVSINKISGDVNEIEFSGTKLKIESYRIDNQTIDVVSDISEYKD